MNSGTTRVKGASTPHHWFRELVSIDSATVGIGAERGHGCGLGAVVLTAVGAAADLIREGVPAFLFASCDCDALLDVRAPVKTTSSGLVSRSRFYTFRDTVMKLRQQTSSTRYVI